MLFVNTFVSYQLMRCITNDAKFLAILKTSVFICHHIRKQFRRQCIQDTIFKMQIIIKVLKGQDCTLDVTPLTTVLQIKQQIEQILKIPHSTQKLLLLGRTLNDRENISFYPNIKDGTKLNLIVMKQGVRDIIYRSFRKYYNESQSEIFTRRFMDDFEEKLKNFSLDDIERMSENVVQS